ncbi:MAG TPA: CsgG/HfaB family protein, partial [Rhodanobacteraceae bacterium]|nr:CsgG/HfaB family protein [Rhodanobacteraceae bacterium]
MAFRVSARRFRGLILGAAACVVLAQAHAQGGKPVLAVLKFQDETGAMPFQGGIGRVVTNMLASELAARDVFTVVERRKLRAILEEQDLAESG